ncbi:MAG TPA: hypothetical protein VGN79_11285 [Devosia sp.]|nr:hypothetical protein [Devosia sp.]
MGELDFIDFEVQEDRYAYALPEVFCVTSEVTAVRDGRYRVEADCNEFGDLWQNSFFLDVVSSSEIRIDGVPHKLCEMPVGGAATHLGGDWQGFLKMPPDTICKFVAIRDTHDFWWEGDSEEPQDLTKIYEVPTGSEFWLLNTQNLEPTIGPEGIELAFAFRGYFVPLQDLAYVWDCGPSR